MEDDTKELHEALKNISESDTVRIEINDRTYRVNPIASSICGREVGLLIEGVKRQDVTLECPWCYYQTIFDLGEGESVADGWTELQCGTMRGRFYYRRNGDQHEVRRALPGELK